jgi:hypothetical protein
LESARANTLMTLPFLLEVSCSHRVLFQLNLSLVSSLLVAFVLIFKCFGALFCTIVARC